jgi:large subunit ribosomal protein L29
MSNKKFKALKDLSKDEIKAKLREAQANLFQTRMQHRTGQLENTGLMWQIRKEITRLSMLQGQAAKSAGKNQ